MEVFGYEVPLWGIFVVLLLSLLYVYSTWTYNTFKNVGIPGPKPWPLLGNIEESFLGYDNYAWELKRKYGRVVGIYSGRKPVIKLFDPKLIKHVLIKDFNTFANRPYATFPNFDPPLDKSLLHLEKETWKKVRSLMTPAFSSGKLRQMSQEINVCANVLVESLESLVGTPVDLVKMTSAFSLDTIARVAFGMQTNAQKDPNDAVLKNTTALSKFGMLRFLLVSTFGGIINFLRLKLRIRLFMGEPLDFFSKLLGQLEDDRKTSKRDYKDFLQLLLDVQDDQSRKKHREYSTTSSDECPLPVKMDNDELTAHTVIFFLGGTDTTGSTLTFLFHSLAFNPEMQDRLIKDIDDVMEDADDVTPEACAQIPYLKQCIYETLRMYPPFRRLDRECSKDIVIEGVQFPAGVTVDIPIDVFHKNPDYWQEPQVFNPDRFSPEEQSARDPLLWLPFGAGPRNCIGMRLAMLEIQVATVKLLRTFHVLPSPDTQRTVVLQQFTVSVPVKSILLQVQRRQ